MLIVYRKYGRRDFAHRPELCYPAAGWEITGKTYTKMFYNGKAIDARLVTAEKDIGREVIAYWFASGDRTEANFAKQQLWMAMDRMQDRRYGWAFIRINVPVLYSDEEALEAARSFLKEMDKPLMKALTGQ
jgi:EpsI family protein